MQLGAADLRLSHFVCIGIVVVVNMLVFEIVLMQCEL